MLLTPQSALVTDTKLSISYKAGSDKFFGELQGPAPAADKESISGQGNAYLGVN